MTYKPRDLVRIVNTPNEKHLPNGSIWRVTIVADKFIEATRNGTLFVRGIEEDQLEPYDGPSGFLDRHEDLIESHIKHMEAGGN